MKLSMIFSPFIFFLALSAQALVPLTSQIQGVDVVTSEAKQFAFPSDHKATVVVFLSAKCPCSASHEDLLNKMSQTFKEFTFVGMHANADETSDIVKKHFSEKNLSFPILHDKKGQLAQLLGALKTPHAFVFDKQGQLLYHGGVTDSHVGPSAKKHFLQEVLEDLRAERPLRHKEGRALGCYIQREED
ncbi:MAG: redoxin family protein [Bdellovibrio sp.]